MKGFQRLLIALVLATTACAGSFIKDTKNQLTALAAVYETAAPARADYCRPWEKPAPEVPPPVAPKPAVCVTALDTLKVVYTTLKDGTELLATYAEVKTDTVKAKIIALIPKVADAIVNAQAVISEVK